MNLADILAHHARNRPSHPAIVEGARIVTYRELDRLVGAATACLRKAGLGEGEVVALAMGDSADHLVVLHALLRLGAAVLPINRSWSAVEQAHFCASLGAAALVGDEETAAIAGIEVIRADAAWREAADEAPPVARQPDLPALLSLSSGTTGMPKAALFTHARLGQRLRYYSTEFGAYAGDRYLVLNHLSFGMPRHAGMAMLQLGGTVVISTPLPRSAGEVVDLVARHRITWISLVPVQLRGLLSFAGGAWPLLSGLRILNATSAALRAEERRAIRERLTPNLFESYSASEGGTFAVASPEDLIAQPDSVGRAALGVEIEIVDDDRRVLPPDAIGQIRLRGPAIVDGYHRNPEATALAFRDGWFYPGDLGRMNADGYLFLAGRRDDVINRDGIKVRPIDVEAALLAHPAVAEAAVVGIRGPEMSEAPIGFVVLRSDVAEAELIAHCRQRLAPFETPPRVFRVSELPKTATGKVQKSRLKERLEARLAQARRASGAAV